MLKIPTTASRPKFHHWFPRYEKHWLHTAAVCKIQLQAYWTNDRSRCWSTCACVTDCMISNTSESIKNNLASASVVLGLMPSILTLLGPSIAEVSILSIRYPVLSILISIGSPAINLIQSTPRLMQITEKPLSASAQPPGSIIAESWHKWLSKRHRALRGAVKIIEYICVLLAILNVIHVSIDLDLRSVSGWACGQMFIPLFWGVVSVWVHFLGMLAVRTRSVRSSNSYRVGTVEPDVRTPTTVKGHLGSRFVPWRLLKSLIWVGSESELWKTLACSQESKVGELLFWLTSIMAMFHMLFGVFAFSSLTFIAALDALPIIARYVASAIVCRWILMSRLVEMQRDLYQSSEV